MLKALINLLREYIIKEKIILWCQKCGLFQNLRKEKCEAAAKFKNANGICRN